MSTGVLCPFWRMLGVNPAARERRLAVCLPRTSWFRQPALAVSQVLFISAVGHAAGALRAAGLSLCWGLCASRVHGQAAGLGTGSAGGWHPRARHPLPLRSSRGGVLGRVHGVRTGSAGLGTGDGGLQAPRGALRALGTVFLPLSPCPVSFWRKFL